MITSQFSPNVSEILSFSREEAARMASSTVGPEHLLMGILRDRSGWIDGFFKLMKVNRQKVKEQLEETVRKQEGGSPANPRELVLNERASNILRLAVLEARSQHMPTVETQHLLLAILHDHAHNGAKDVLESNSISYEDALKYVNVDSKKTVNGIDLPEEDDEELTHDGGRSQRMGSSRTARATETKSKTPVLDNFSTDLTKAAKEGKLDPVIGRHHELQRVMEILCRRKKNNPILIGEPGVGKSAIVEGLAQMIVEHRTSPILFNKRLVSLDLTSMVAGTKFRGQFEERVKALLSEIEQDPDIIVFIDEIHTMIGAGSAPGTMDAANILKPALARGAMQCIGATTLDEYRNSIEKDGALERRFQKVLVEATTADETLEIIRRLRDRYQEHHHVNYTDEALVACVRLTERYVTDRSFPDKAIDAMDEVGARVHLQHAHIPPEIEEKEKELSSLNDKKEMAVKNQNYELAAAYRDKKTTLEQELKAMKDEWASGLTGSRETVTDEHVADVVSMMTGVPVQRMAESEGIRLRDMGNVLKTSVVGQDKAIDKMTKAIQRNRVGLKDPNRPIGVFMFLGPTGVGKTYLAKKLAEHMFGSADSLIRVDMSEYSESFNVSRLVGAPPGYVGYEEGGQLTEKVRRHPYSIVLLDEIEKAHGNVFNMLLQVLDEGRLTDGNGRLIDFRNTVVIMTSNAGTRQLKEFGRGIGFAASGNSMILDENDREHARSIIQKSLSRQFAPEFLNRLDEIITFDQLSLEHIKQIVDIELKSVIARIEALGYHLEVSDSAKEFLAVKGYDVQYGARPLKRAIQNHIEDAVCEKILGEEVKLGATLHVTRNEGEDHLTINCQ